MFDFDPKKNYYDILGVGESANEDEIKKAFRKQAMQHHPDKGGDQEKFKAINEAYQVIGDAGKKSQYDSVRKGGGGFGGYDFGGSGFGWGTQFDFWGVDLGDLMGDLLGGGFSTGGRRSKRASKWEDLQTTCTITFEESYKGTTKEVSYQRMVQEDGLSSSTCPVCNGSGATVQQVRTPFGVMQTQATCERCEGTGKIFLKGGKEVEAWGLVKKSEKITVKIPEGIDDDVYIKYPGMGNDSSSGASSWDLYIKIQIKASEIFTRRGEDIYAKVEVSIFDMVLGGEATIDHPEGKVTFKIPKGTQVWDMIRIANKGFSTGGKVFAKRGNMIITPKINIPKKLSKEQEKLWKQLQEN